MIFIVINLLDLFILAFALHWAFSVWPIRNNPLTRFVDKICAPVSRGLPQFILLSFKGNAVPPQAIAILCLAFLRFAFSALS